MFELGKLSPLAFNRMTRRGISMATLAHLLAYGNLEKKPDGARLAYLAGALPCPAGRSPKRTFDAVLDAADDVHTVTKRVRL